MRFVVTITYFTPAGGLGRYLWRGEAADHETAHRLARAALDVDPRRKVGKIIEGNAFLAKESAA